MPSVKAPAKVSGRSTAVVLWLMITLVFLPIVMIHGIAAVLAARDSEVAQRTASLAGDHTADPAARHP